MITKPENHCGCGTYQHTVPMCIARSKVVQIDLCVSELVAALEAGGFEPAASCCGHGVMPPSVLLNDRRHVVVLTHEQAEETVKRYTRKAGGAE